MDSGLKWIKTVRSDGTANMNVTNFISNLYPTYLLRLDGRAGTDDSEPSARVSFNNGATYHAGADYMVFINFDRPGDTNNVNGATETSIPLSRSAAGAALGSASGEHITCDLWLTSTGTNLRYPSFGQIAGQFWNPSGTQNEIDGYAGVTVLSGTTAVQFAIQNTWTASSKVSVYGVKEG